LILLLIFTLVSTFLSLVAMQQVSLAREHKAVVARNLAEAGLHLAAAKLRTAPDYRGESGMPLGDGTFDVRVQPLPPFIRGGQGGVTRRGRQGGVTTRGWEITATGHVPVLGEAKLQRTVRARAVRRGGEVRLEEWQEMAGN
jgi:hypothetical protein